MAFPPCPRCGKRLEILQNPVKRLKGTGFQWQGFKSLFSEPLRNCTGCGAVYSADGSLMAAAVIETAQELSVKAYRDDMAHLRDAFAAVTIAAELGVAWMFFGSRSFGIFSPLLTMAVGVLSVFPFVFFAKRVRAAERDIEALRSARIRGQATPDVAPPLVASSTTDE